MSCSTTMTECVAAMSLSSSRGLRGLGVGHAGGRLVDQQQLRVLRQQHADLQPLLLAVAEVGGQVVALVAKPDGAEDIVDPRAPPRPRAVEQRRERSRAAPSAPARDCPRRCGFRTPSASGTCGRCRAWRSPPRRAWSGRRLPSKKTSPSSGRVLPVTTSIIVVLPAPFGPMMARISPVSTTSDRSFSALKPSKRDGDAVEVEERAWRSSSWPTPPPAVRRSTRAGPVPRLRERASAAPDRRRARLLAGDARRRPAREPGLASVPTMPLRQEQRDGDEQAAEREQPESGSSAGEPASCRH